MLYFFKYLSRNPFLLDYSTSRLDVQNNYSDDVKNKFCHLFLLMQYNSILLMNVKYFLLNSYISISIFLFFNIFYLFSIYYKYIIIYHHKS